MTILDAASIVCLAFVGRKLGCLVLYIAILEDKILADDDVPYPGELWRP